MAEYITYVVIGDYHYDLYDDQTAKAYVTDKSKSSYVSPQASVTHGGVTYALTDLTFCFYNCTALTTAPSIPSGVTDMGGCFYGCTSLTTAPSIPSDVTQMASCFYGCTSLTTAPSIPSGVTSISQCFYGCTSLTTAPSIPSGVTSIIQCFYGCTSLTTAPSIPSSVTRIDYCFTDCIALTGTIFVHGTPTIYGACFLNTMQPIVLVVTDSSETSTWQAVARTGNNGNVTVLDVSANPAPTATIAVARVDAVQSTTPDEDSRIIYVTVRTTVSTEQAPDNVAFTPIVTVDDDHATLSYTDGGTGTWNGWYILSDDFTHEFTATPRDLYKTGTTITINIASTYSPMEFYQGGTGASFGKHAESAGVLDVGWDIHTDGIYTMLDNTVIPSVIRNVFDIMYPVGSIYMSTEKNATNGDPKIAAFIPGSKWTRITGKFLLAATDNGSSGASQAVNNTGGEATHTLTTGETPLKSHHHGLNNHTHSMSHNHRVGIIRSNAEANGYGLTQTAGFQNRVIVQSSASGRYTSEGSSAANTGGSTANTTDTENTSATAHNNMPPYLAVYIWERTA